MRDVDYDRELRLRHRQNGDCIPIVVFLKLLSDFQHKQVRDHHQQLSVSVGALL